MQEPIPKPIFITIIYKSPRIIFEIRSSIDYFENELKKVDLEFWDRLNNNNNTDDNSNNGSSIKIGSKNKIDKSVIGNNNEVSFTNNKNTIRYYGTRKNNFLHKMVSELLIGYFGKTEVRNVGIGSFIAGTILTLSSGYSMDIYFFFYLGVILIFIGCLFIYALFHSNTTTCKVGHSI